MKLLIIALAFLITACSTVQEPIKTEKSSSQQVLSKSDSIYHFQHKLLPNWTFNSKGQFYTDLKKYKTSKLKNVAAEFISPEYSSEIKISVIDGHDAVLITFPTPSDSPHCFYILVTSSNNKHDFYTFEKTPSYGEDDQITGAVGSWTKEGSHLNLGFRTYTKASDFVQDILENG